jgi:hypothetical protein
VLPFVICLVPGFQPNTQAALTFKQKIELIESIHVFPYTVQYLSMLNPGYCLKENLLNESTLSYAMHSTIISVMHYTIHTPIFSYYLR